MQKKAVPARGPALQGGRIGDGPLLYDGSHQPEPVLHDHAEKGGQAKTAGYLYRHLHCGHRGGRVFLQCDPVPAGLIQCKSYAGVISQAQKQAGTMVSWNHEARGRAGTGPDTVRRSLWAS